MELLTYELMDKRTKANTEHSNYLFGWWSAYRNVVGSHYTRYNHGNEHIGMDKSHQTNSLELDFASETYNSLMGVSFKAYFISLVKDLKAYFINMDSYKQTNNLNV
jgi:hypothetical protein